MINAVAYFRLNASKQDIAQCGNTNITFFENYAMQNNMKLVCIYIDFENPNPENRVAFNRMIEDSQTGNNAFDIVLVKNNSLLSKNLIDFFIEDICAEVSVLDDNADERNRT